MSKQTIQVRQYSDYNTYTVLATIKRKVWAEQCGNFNPLFCCYKPFGQRCLVESDAGDLSDPFRRSDEYAQSLFIRHRGEDGKVIYAAA